MEADTADVESVVAEWGLPFCDGWEHLAPILPG
jgi:hypothetical protein